MALALRGTHPGAARSRITATLAIAALAAAALLSSGCGGSSKPSYCSAVTNLENSIKAVPSTDVLKNGLSSLQSAVTKVQTDAKAVVDAAKSDFPNQTTAIKNATDNLSGTLKQLASSPSAATAALVPAQISAVTTSVKDFTSATSSKCG